MAGKLYSMGFLTSSMTEICVLASAVRRIAPFVSIRPSVHASFRLDRF